MAQPEPADGVLPPEPQAGAHAAAEAAAAAAREVYETSKKREAVVVDGFVMIKHFVSANGMVQHWRCDSVNKTKCNARGESVAGTTAVVMREKYSHHNHESSVTAIKVRKIQNDVKDQAKRHDMASAAVIVDHALRGAGDDVVLALPRDNLLRLASNARRVAGARHVNRSNVADIVFPDTFKTTAGGEQFLLVDSRTAQPAQSVFFIFASPVQLRELRRRQHWAVDGTFYCTPTKFDSVFTIHVHVEHSSVPVAYFLLQDRTEATYRRALAAFVDAANLRFVQPVSIMSDFEVAAINALRATFPASAIRLCLFHLAQSAFRNIAEQGLVPLYRGNAAAQEILRCFPALASLPPDDVVDGLHLIVDELNRMLAAGEIDPLWEAQIAGWHHAFNNMFPAPHMALDKFIARLKNDEDITRQRLLRNEVLAAEPIRRRRQKRYLVADKHLRTLAQRYVVHYRANGEILRYLRCVQHHLQKPRFPGEAADVAEDPLEEVAEDANGGDEGGVGPAGGRPIPRRESHPGDGHLELELRRGLEPEEPEEDADEHDGAPGVNGGAAEAGGVRQVNFVDEPLPGFSQAEGVANRQHGVHWGPVQLPSQSSSSATTSNFVRRPAAAPGSHRGPPRLPFFRGGI